jgi:hypothetical protein
LEAQRDFARDHPWFAVQQVPAATHFAMVETAREAGSAIEPFVGAD